MSDKKKVIFLDLDGVLFDWMTPAATACGLDPTDPTTRQFLKTRRLEQHVGTGHMWKSIDDLGVDFWANLELFPWSLDLYNKLSKVENSELCFLTAPSRNPVCAAGKMMAIQRHFPRHSNCFLLGNKKHYCASPKSILIDDTQKKIDSFKEWGGYTFHWPEQFSLVDGDVSLNDTYMELFSTIDSMEYDDSDVWTP